MYVVAIITGQVRLRKKAFANPEDALRNGGLQYYREDPDVERCRRRVRGGAGIPPALQGDPWQLLAKRQWELSSITAKASQSRRASFASAASQGKDTGCQIPLPAHDLTPLGAASTLSDGGEGQLHPGLDALSRRNGRWQGSLVGRNNLISLFRAHCNDMENIFPFLFLGAIYSLLDPSPAVARIHFFIFCAGRIIHTIAYLLRLKAPTRSVAYSVAQLPCFSMALQILLATTPYW
ncbi:hypothetical protein QYF61_024770 [Mycteria americana]|uniref:Prostaglandin E synthase n=2 Tax=Mycteria americana TaxID=33587 RepID=A0AAN7RY29_MYCAM|nr:hypothetical protein QYF61_024770 [Mycteria americana]